MAEPNDWTPRKVVLFSGHMIDAPGREKPRFPPDKEPIAANAIAKMASLDIFCFMPVTSAAPCPIIGSARASDQADLFGARLTTVR